MTSTAPHATPAHARPEWLVPALVALVASVVTWWASTPYLVGVFHDDGVYALLGKAIAEGHGFRYLQLPGAPTATHYPPLYPLALAALWRVAPAFPENIPVLLGFNALCIGATAVGLYEFGRRQLGWREELAALTALAALLTTPILTLAGALFSEPLFLAALFPLLIAAERCAKRPTTRSSLAIGACIGLLMLERTHGVALLGALVLVLLLRREWRAAALVAASAIAVQLPWIIWTSRAELVAPPLRGAYGSYAGWFVDGLRTGGVQLIVDTVRINARELWLMLADRVVVGLPSPFGMLALALLVLLLLAGAVAAIRRAPVTLIFLAAYLAIVLIIAGMPWRYIWGVWPLYVLFAVLGAEEIWRRAQPRAQRVVVLAALAVPLAAMVTTEARAYANKEWTRPARAAARQAIPVVEWVRHNTRPDDVVLAECEEVVTLFTGRRSAPPGDFTAIEYLRRRNADEDRRALGAMLDAVPATHVVSLMPEVQLAARTMRDARPALRELPGVPGAAAFVVVR